MRGMPIRRILWTVGGGLLALWLVGWATGFAGFHIHLLLFPAGVLFVVSLLTGRLRI